MKTNNKSFLVGCLTLGFVLVGCGGGSTTTTTPETQTSQTQTSQNQISETNTTKSAYSVTGTVPGTLIEAFCKDGSYHKVSSSDNGTENHPFTIEIPKGVDCKFIMTTNENDVDTSKHIVTPLLFNNGTTTSSYFQLSDDIELGHIALPMSGEGVQAPLTVSISEDKLEVHEYSYDPLDTDHDNIPNVYEDDDNDGITNIHDEDDDGDGIEDTKDSDYENDTDGDGIENSYDADDDNDELEDEKDDDDDNDNIKDEDDNDENESYNETNATNITLPTNFKVDAGRLLGSQCAQCHGTNGISVNEWDSIAGKGDLAGEIFGEAPIMDAQAHGYTTEEITLIGNWLKTLNKNED